ncbi:MAG: hypothetical protein PHW77_04195 [Eubacteriales bacterium]|nr:hypothetical protein [Eubacteriales bacterium]
MSFWTITELVFTALVLVTSIWKAVRATIRLSKDKTLYPMILQFITEAEATGKSGPEKLGYVLVHIEAFAKSKGFSVDLGYIKDLIERIITVTKSVNINR